MATTTVTKPTLTYFGMAGLAETPRLLLEEAGVDYDYVALEHPNWAELKPAYIAAGKTPFGQLPLYEEPGLTLVQASAITRYLAKKHGFAGTNDREAALIDQAYEGVIDILSRLVQIFRQTTDEQKAAVKEKLVTEFLPGQLELFSKLLEKNGNNGFLVGSKLSYADVGLWSILNLMFLRAEGSRDVAEKFAPVKDFLAGVSARDKIKAYIARDVYAKKE